MENLFDSYLVDSSKVEEPANVSASPCGPSADDQLVLDSLNFDFLVFQMASEFPWDPEVHLELVQPTPMVNYAVDPADISSFGLGIDSDSDYTSIELLSDAETLVSPSSSGTSDSGASPPLLSDFDTSSVSPLLSPTFSPSPPPAPELYSPSSYVPNVTYDYLKIRRGVEHDVNLMAQFDNIIDGISQGRGPSKDEVADFLVHGAVGQNPFLCPFAECKWHATGWKREDRGVAHLLKEHFVILKYPCDECHRTYKWSHDLNRHRLLHHAGSTADIPLYECDKCPQTFNKSSNLTRHYGRVHKKGAATRRKARHHPYHK